MVLAIGIVVDDAIVVLENVERLMREEKHERASRRRSRRCSEVSGAVIAIVLVLCAVFIPVAFLGGIAGHALPAVRGDRRDRGRDLRLRRAHADAGAVRAAAQARRPRVAAASGRSTSASRRLTQTFLSLRRAARCGIASSSVLAIFVGVIALAGAAVLARADELRAARGPGLHHQLDHAARRARRSSAPPRPARSSSERCRRTRRSTTCSSSPAATSSAAATRPTPATSFILLKHWDDREKTAPQLAGEMIAAWAARFADGMALAFNPPAIRGLGTAGGFEVYVQARARLRPASASRRCCRASPPRSRSIPRCRASTRSSAPTVPQLLVEVNREQAMALGVPVSDVFDALQSTMGPLYVNDFNMSGRTYRVQLQADAPYRAQPDDLGQVYVRSTRPAAR